MRRNFIGWKSNQSINISLIQAVISSVGLRKRQWKHILKGQFYFFKKRQGDETLETGTDLMLKAN